MTGRPAPSLTYGSVCSGIEAATVAWHPLGWHPAFFSEIEAFPRALLAERWPGVPIHGDFTTIKDGNYEPIQLLVGGTPCQDFSVAGLRAGLAGNRGSLTIEFVHLARRLRPRWLVWENVPGILSIDDGRAFGAFLALLGQCGYGFAYRILDAQHFGVPQRRRRVFVVGYLGDWRPAAAVLFEPESLRGHSAPGRETGKRVARPIAGSLEGGSGYRNDADTADNLIAFHGTQDPDISGAIAHPLGRNSGQENAIARCDATGSNGQRYDYETETLVTHSLRADGFDASEGGTGRGTPLIPIQSIQSVREKRQNGIGVGDDGGEMFTLTNRDRHAVAFESRYARNGRGAPDSVVPPLKAQSGESGKGDAAPLLHSGMSVRRLTPRECERLQGFPDDYTAITYRGKSAADGPRYRALGNSMAVPCMRWIGERIETVDALMALETVE